MSRKFDTALHHNELLPVPPEMVPKLWHAARRVALSKIPGYDCERTHLRLLAGMDQLWVAHSNQDYLIGVVITSISARPPSTFKRFERKDPKLMKSLTIHLAGEYYLMSWLDSAIERVSRYAREHECRQMFWLLRKNWHEYAKRFYSREWEAVAVSRDRPTYSTCKKFMRRNTPGYFRLMVPVPADKWTRHMHGFMETFRFVEEVKHESATAA